MHDSGFWKTEIFLRLGIDRNSPPAPVGQINLLLFPHWERAIFSYEGDCFSYEGDCPKHACRLLEQAPRGEGRARTLAQTRQSSALGLDGRGAENRPEIQGVEQRARQVRSSGRKPPFGGGFRFRRQVASVKFIGTYAEYDRIDALTVSQF